MKQQNNIKDAAKQSMKGQVDARNQGSELNQIQKPREYLLGLMSKSEKQFLRLFASDTKAVQRFFRVTLSYISKNESLLECTPNSIIGCMLLSAELGLEFGYLGQAHMVPFFNNKAKPPRKEAQFIPGYQGLMLLAQRTGDIVSTYGDVVYEGDDFNYQYGINADLVHKPKLDLDKKTTKRRCVYAYAKTRSGFYFTVMSINEVQKIRQSSKAPDSPAWKEWTDEMFVKSAFRKLSKLLPKESSIEHMKLWKAAVMDDAAQKGLIQGLDPEAFDELEGMKIDPDNIFETEILDEQTLLQEADKVIRENGSKVKSIAEHITGKDDFNPELFNSPTWHIQQIESFTTLLELNKHLKEHNLTMFGDADRKLIDAVIKTQMLKFSQGVPNG